MLRPTARLIATALLAGIVLLAVSAGGSRAAASVAAATDPYDVAVVRELNRVRAAHDLAPLRFDVRMARSADAHSRAQARVGAIAHGAWNGRVARAAGHPNRVGEVLGWLSRGTPAAEARGVVTGWLGSPTHRPLVLDRGFRRVGIGRATGVLSGVDAAVHTVDFATARY